METEPDDGPTPEQRVQVDAAVAKGHSRHCACRQIFGDGLDGEACECGIAQQAAIRARLAAVTSDHWSWEEHGKGWALYAGRGFNQHGLNLLTVGADGFDRQGPALRELIGQAPADLQRLLAIVDRLIVERNAAMAEAIEAQTEAAAWRGLGEGGLPGWTWWPHAEGRWNRELPMTSEQPRRVLAAIRDIHGRFWTPMLYEGRWIEISLSVGGSPRAAMREAEAEAIRRGWMKP